MARIKPSARGHKVNYSYPTTAYYLPSTLIDTYSRANLEKEYRKLRNEAQSRLKAFEGTKYQQNKAYQNAKQFLTSATNPRKLNKRQLATGLTDLYGFLSSSRSTLTGTRKAERKQLETFRDVYGMKWLNRSNVDEFLRFLDWVKEMKGVKYQFDEVVSLYRSAKFSKLPLDRIKLNYEFYAKQIDLTDDPNTTRQYLKRERKQSSNDMRKAIKR